MGQKILTIVGSLTICGLMNFGFQNCARTQFLVDPFAKSEALSKENVFGNQQGDDGSIAGTQQGDDGSIAGTQPGDDGSLPKGGGLPGKPPMGNDSSVPGKTPPDKNPPLSNLSVNFIFECSNAHTSSVGGNLLTASAVKVVIAGRGNNFLCEVTGDFKTEILNTKKLNFKPCAGLAPGKYDVHVVDEKVSANLFISKDFIRDKISFTVNADGTYSLMAKPIRIIYDTNSSHSLYNQFNEQFGNASTAETQKRCDKRVSPLIVSMGSETRGIKLTAPLDGIQFDILGQNSFPRAHDKKQISWFTPEVQEYYFIVLPGKDGKVLGIDQMFGDNTKGPDGNFAANGYAALAKYDSDRDNLITDEDEVYGDLRLWLDSDRNGIAELNEIFTLKEKGVILIDLHYDQNYKEVDPYGNQTLMKSVVKTEDGKLHLLFDLWFRYLNITK
jgi:hypothetical protein